MSDVITAMTCEDDPIKFQKFVYPSRMRWSIKLDGVRTLVRDIGGEVSFWSRSGKSFPNFQRFAPDITNMAQALRALRSIPAKEPVWFDGEMTAKSREFKGVMQHLRRHKEVDPTVFEFHVFDCPTIGMYDLDYRLGVIEDIIDWVDPEDIHMVPHYIPANGWNSVERVFDQKVKDGEEGIIVKDALSQYEYKRSRSWLKMKKEETLDLPVIGFKPGKGKYTGMVGALTCQLPNGKTVDVSGFTDEQRAWFTMDLPEMIEVKHNGVTSGGKLRHPRFVCVREDK